MHKKHILDKMGILDKILMAAMIILLVIKVHSDLPLDFVSDIYTYCILINMSIKLFRGVKEKNKNIEDDPTAKK